MQGVPLVVLANKQDLINALPAAEVRSCRHSVMSLSCIECRPSALHSPCGWPWTAAELAFACMKHGNRVCIQPVACKGITPSLHSQDFEKLPCNLSVKLKRLSSANKLLKFINVTRLSGVFSANNILNFINVTRLSGIDCCLQIASSMSLPTIRDRPWQIQGCCAKTGEGLNQGMEWLIKQLQ